MGQLKQWWLAYCDNDATPAGNDYENVCAKVAATISRGVDVYEFHPPFRRSMFPSRRIAWHGMEADDCAQIENPHTTQLT